MKVTKRRFLGTFFIVTLCLVFLLSKGSHFVEQSFAATPVPAWFSVQGRVHSDTNCASGCSGSSGVSSNVPSGKTFSSALNAIISAADTIFTGSGNFGTSLGMTNYPINSTPTQAVSYSSLLGRVANQNTYADPSASYNAAPTGQGIRIITNPANDFHITGAWTVNSGEYLLMFVPGKLVVEQNVTVAPGGFLGFIVKGNIIIKKDVTTVQGLFYTGGIICTKESTSGTCTP